MKIPVYDPQINASTSQYNAVADIRTNTLGEIADGLQQYGKFREAQLEEERKTEQFKADAAIRYELDDARSKMLDSIQNGGAYADAEAKYQETFDRSQFESPANQGSTPFLSNPKSYRMGDGFVRGEASALIGEFNQQATQAFADWRKAQLAKFKDKSQVPSAGELESAFTRTDAFRELRQQFADKNREILRRPGGPSPSKGETPADFGIGLGIGGAPKEQPTSIRGRSLKNPEIKPQEKPQTPSARDFAPQFGGRQ